MPTARRKELENEVHKLTNTKRTRRTAVADSRCVSGDKLYPYNLVTLFFDAALIVLDHGANVFVSRKEIRYLRFMV